MPDLETPTARPPRPGWLLVILILLSLGYLTLFALSAMMVLTSPLVFDSGDTARNRSAFFQILLSPVVVVLATVISWYGFGARRYLMIPLGPVLPVIYGAIFWFSYS